MTIYEGLTLAFIGLGMLFVALGFTFGRTREVARSHDEAMEDEAFRKQINLVNEKVLELDDYHNFVKDEIEKKHKELLFLYQMISEKEKAIRQIQLEIEQLKEEPEAYIEEKVPQRPDTDTSDRSNRRIIALREQGYDAREIAKIMNIGVGEVNLVLNLFD